MKGRAVLLLLLGCLVWLAPVLPTPNEVAFWRGAAFSDLLISHWPSAVFLRRSILEWGQVPLWNPTILSGTPFFADPLSGLWYPPMWLASWLDPALAFNLLTYLHLVWAGWGTWRLLRSVGVGDPAAGLAGLAFSGSPKLIGHFGLGHVTLVFAFCWMPWVLLALDSAMASLAGPLRHRLRRSGIAGAACGLIFLIDPRWFPFVILIGIPFATWRVAHSHTENRRGTWGRAAGGLGLAGLVSAGVAAGLALPLGEFARLATRGTMSAAEAAAFALPLDRLLNLLAADLAAWPEWQTYSGVVVLYLGAVGLALEWRRVWFWGAVAAVSTLAAVGDASPIYLLLRWLVPGFGALRVPPRSLMVAALALAILAAAGLQRILDRDSPPRRVAGIAAGLAGPTLVVGWLAAGGAPAGQKLIIGIPYLLSATLIGISLLWIRSSRSLGSRAWVGWLALIVVDLGLVNFVTLEVRPGAGGLEPRVQAAAELVTGRPPFRFYSPSYSLPQPSAARLGLETADGIDPLQLARYSEYMSMATGIDGTSYSVTLPPFPQDGPYAARPVNLDSDQLGLLSIAEVLSAYPVEADGLRPAGRLAGHYRYANPEVRPRAWIQTEGTDGWRPVESEDWTPNRIRVRATGPGRLVLSELAYPGWRVEVDGDPAPLQTEIGLLRAVDLQTGEHEIEFVFRPASLIAGLAITALTSLSLVSLWIRR